MSGQLHFMVSQPTPAEATGFCGTCHQQSVAHRISEIVTVVTQTGYGSISPQPLHEQTFSVSVPVAGVCDACLSGEVRRWYTDAQRQPS